MKRHKSAIHEPEMGRIAGPVSATRKRAGKALCKPLEELEVRVQKRTAELSRANKALREDAERLS